MLNWQIQAREIAERSSDGHVCTFSSPSKIKYVSNRPYEMHQCDWCHVWKKIKNN